MRGRAAAQILAGTIALVGCASPGPPHAPTLNLPQPVRDLGAARDGDRVTLRFTLPQRTTDNLPIRDNVLRVSVCRGSEGQPCVPVPGLNNVSLAMNASGPAASRQVVWHDELPGAEMMGDPRLLLYRVELMNVQGKTAGWSEPAYTAAGASPPAVQGFHAEETRAGILLAWQPSPAPESSAPEVVLRRELISPPPGAKHEQTEPVWLDTHAAGVGQTLDATAAEDSAYRYTAVRRIDVTLGEHKLVLDSAASPAAEITWHNAFPPTAPLGLSAAPFTENGAFVVDLVWEPVEEPGLRGYTVTRQPLDASGVPSGSLEVLTPRPLQLPALHDTSARPGISYRYTVQAISHKDVPGQPATAVVAP